MRNAAPSVAVLCVSPRSIYKTLDVDAYDVKRDARTYRGDLPVVAHPPCRAWSRYCRHQAKPEPGERELGPFCVDVLRRVGGVLEHPAHSLLFDELDLPKPGGVPRDGLFTLAVDQSWFGYDQSKTTWRRFAHVPPNVIDLPYRLHVPTGDRRRWQLKSKQQRAATPPALAAWLVEVAKQSVAPRLARSVSVLVS